MAKNRKFANGRKLSVICSHPTTPVSGDPVRVGKLAGVALIDEEADGTTTVDFEGVYEINVDDDAATGIAPGDTLYYQDAATGSPATNVNNNATTPEAIFGTALGTLSANATGKINVRLGGTAAIS
jgi:predicted RecA/RadA family phage recombinase